MPHTEVTFQTLPGNPPPLKVCCTCDDLWSVSQQRAMLELYPPEKGRGPEVLDLSRVCTQFIASDPELPPELPRLRTKDIFGNIREIHEDHVREYEESLYRYAARARRIARGYARLYLERFEHGNPVLRGRFYWAGLAAFASKQVASTLSHVLVQRYAPDSVEALGMGNLWLYNDAWPWHYAWALCSQSVQMCAEQRDAQALHPIVLDNLMQQDWAAEVVPNVPWHIDEATGRIGKPIGQLRIAPLMQKAIELWQCIADETRESERSTLALKHLMIMARHEQGEVLQGLVYSRPGLVEDLQRARELRGTFGIDKALGMFKLQLSFSPDEYTDDDERRSDAPRYIQLEDYKQRMKWIEDAARKYHFLMTGDNRVLMLIFLDLLANHDG